MDAADLLDVAAPAGAVAQPPTFSRTSWNGHSKLGVDAGKTSLDLGKVKM